MNQAHQIAQSPGGAGPSAETTTDAAIFAPAEKTGNRIATLKAQLALKGFAVHDVSTGGYFVSRWNMAKFCPAIVDLESFAAQVGAPA